MLSVLIVFIIIIYLITTFGTILTIGHKNDWNDRAILPAVFIGIIPIINILYIIINIQYFCKNLKL